MSLMHESQANNAGRRRSLLDVYGLRRAEAVHYVNQLLVCADQQQWDTVKIVFGRAGGKSLFNSEHIADELSKLLTNRKLRFDIEQKEIGSILVYLPTTNFKREVQALNTLKHHLDTDMKGLTDVDKMMEDDEQMWLKLGIAVVWVLSLVGMNYLFKTLI